MPAFLVDWGKTRRVRKSETADQCRQPSQPSDRRQTIQIIKSKPFFLFTRCFPACLLLTSWEDILHLCSTWEEWSIQLSSRCLRIRTNDQRNASRLVEGEGTWINSEINHDQGKLWEIRGRKTGAFHACNLNSSLRGNLYSAAFQSGTFTVTKIRNLISSNRVFSCPNPDLSILFALAE